MPFLIQGIFFQNQQWLGLGVRQIEGVIAVVHSGLCQFIYAGVMWQDPEHVMGGLTGHMQDACGNSALSDIYVSEFEVRFTKKYERRKDVIRYTFKVRDGQTWVGEYEGEACGKGISRCLITEVGEEFFQPESIMTKLGRTKAHEWPEGV